MRKVTSFGSTRGFTLVELSIVLVVIGLLIGSILVAMNIIQNARVTNTVTLLQSVQSAVSTYSQNYGALPGDDKGAKARFSSVAIPNDGGGNGVIGSGTLAKTFDTTSDAAGDGAGESGLVWSHLRASGLLKGDGTSITQPGNPFGGIVGIQNGAFATNGIGVGTNVVCVSGIAGAAARIVDQRLDDGNAKTGAMRGGTDITADAADYADGTSYILCMGL